MDKTNIISFFTDNNEEVQFVLLEQTKINGQTYLLAHSEDDDETAYILKDLSDESDEDSVYELLEDEDELQIVSKVFEELLEDVSLEIEED